MAYLDRLCEERRRLYDKHGFKWDSSEDGYCYRTSRLVRPAVVRRLCKLDVLIQRMHGQRPASPQQLEWENAGRSLRRPFRASDYERWDAPYIPDYAWSMTH